MSDVTTGPLRQYLQEGRDAMMRALEELGEYDARRPLTPSGTNILGLVKHLVGVERSYLGECVGRPPKFTLPWEEDGSIWDGATSGYCRRAQGAGPPATRVRAG